VILPSAPTNEQKFWYVRQNKTLLYGWGVFSFAALIIGLALFSAHAWVWWFFTSLLFIYLGISYFIGIFGKSFSLVEHNSIKALYSINYQPTVDVYLPSCGEPLEVIENTFRHARALDWPEGKIHFWVLDDSHRESVRMLADRFEFNYIARPNRGEMKKAGNIRYAFPQTDGDLILILDADFCPRPDMLKEMIPYFAQDSKIAIVQSPQFFTLERGQSLVEKGAAYVQELFYRMVQTNRDTWGASICVGTCAIYRRSMLEPHGGTYAIEYSEDMHTGWQMLVDGFRVKYIPLNLSKGACPDTAAAYFIQQLRWCTGSTSLLTSKKFWQHSMPFMQRICYMSGMLYYVATAVSVVLSPIPAILVLAFRPDQVHWFNYVYSVPSFLMGTFIVAMWGRNKFGWYVLEGRHISYWAHAFALFDRLRGSIQAWVPTGQVGAGKNKRFETFKRVALLYAGLTTAITWIFAINSVDITGWANVLPSMFFSVFYFAIHWTMVKK
jgi:cellulose synthase/poly-beta-1,6-N-acetylglucosamine synthase-like glycosyltransferase